MCLERAADHTGKKISKVCNCSATFSLKQESPQSSMLFQKLLMLGFLCSVMGRGDFLCEDHPELFSNRAALAENSFLLPSEGLFHVVVQDNF